MNSGGRFAARGGCPGAGCARAAFAAIAALAALAVHGAAAQDAVPRSAEPGQIEKRFEQPAAPVAPVAPLAPALPEAVVDIRESPDSFILSAVDISGATVYAPAELAALYEGLLTRRITLADVERLVESITHKYQEDGYALSRAIAPPQSVELGILRIQVIEGYVERVAFAGDTASYQSMLDAQSAAIRAERPLTLATLERGLLMLSDLPGIQVRPQMRAIDDDTGAYELTIHVTQDAVSAFLGLDNYGTRPVGRLQSYATVDLNSVLGRGEMTRLTLFTVPDDPHELRYGELRHEHPIGTDGTRVAVFASLGLVDTGPPLRDSSVESRALRTGIEVRHPVIRRRTESLVVNALAYGADLDQDAFGAPAFRDRVRGVAAGARYTFTDALGGLNLITTTLTQGLPVFNASEEGDRLLSRPRGDGEFTKLNLEAVRQQRLGGAWSAFLSLAGQIAGSALLSSEEFGLGGARYGRGYDPSEVTGSDGFGTTLELRYDGNLESAGVPVAYQLYGFYDFGIVWNDSTLAGTMRDSLASAGAGVRFGWRQDASGGIEFAHPLTHGVASAQGERDLRVLFRLGAKF
jgi:hemolysin activation/secretion protein